MTDWKHDFHINQLVVCDVLEIVPIGHVFGKVVAIHHPYYSVDFQGQVLKIHTTALTPY